MVTHDIPTENEIRDACTEWLLYHHWLVMRINSGAAKPERADGSRGFVPFNRWQVLGDDEQTAGASDLLAFKSGSKPLCVETKVPGNFPTPAQRRFMTEWITHGGQAIVATGIDDLEKWIAK